MPTETGGTTAGDVFISFSSADMVVAEALVTLLDRAGISYYFYPHHNLQPSETNFLEGICGALARAKVVVLIASPMSADSIWVQKELTRATSAGLAIVPIKITPFDMPQHFSFLIASALWLDIDHFLTHERRVLDRIGQEMIQRDARTQRAFIEPVATPVVPIAPTGKPKGIHDPYPGPRAFGAHMHARFFGRDKDAAEIMAMLGGCRILVLFSPSGAGKSSLLAAQLAPDLRKRNIQVFPSEGAGALRVNVTPPDSYVRGDDFNGFLYSLMTGLAGHQPASAAARLAPFLGSLDRPASAVHRTIIIDQFEEIFFRESTERSTDRTDFMEALMDALAADPSLRIVLALRKEYLADVNDLLRVADTRYLVQRYGLGPIDTMGAREAITKPVAEYVAFEPAALDELIRQLRQITIRRANGDLVVRDSEFIEMVHLQIVCLRLWKEIPLGTKTLTPELVRQAAGPEQQTGALVVDALKQFYKEKVDEVANDVKRSVDSILLGCSKFVSAQGTRLMLRSRDGHTGRLPDEVAESLVDRYLLRRERRGTETWYELSHDLFIEPVVSARDLKEGALVLLFATELLERLLEKVLHEHAHTLDAYFVPQKDLLNECRPLAPEIELFSAEQELLLRAALACDADDTRLWCGKMGKEYVARRDAILREAILSATPLVRRNAVDAICHEKISHLYASAVELATRDPDESVRQAASIGLARVNDPALYRDIAHFLGASERHDPAIAALAMVRNRAAVSDDAGAFPTFFASLPMARKNAIRRRSAALRAHAALPLAVLVFLLSAGLATVVATLFKAIPGYWGWGVSQHTPNPFIGMFQGAVAGVFWAGAICTGLTFYYAVFGSIKKTASAIYPRGALLVGGASGLLASLVISIAILGVFNADSLTKMGWLRPTPEEVLARPAPDKDAPQACVLPEGAVGNAWWSRWETSYRVVQSFHLTGFAWVNLVTGTALGLGIALMTNAIRSTPQWDRLLRRETGKIESLAQLKRAFHRIVLIGRTKIWLLCLPIVVGAVLAYQIPDTVHCAAIRGGKANPVALMQGLAGDCATQFMGALAGIAGTLLATIIARHGVSIERSVE